MKRIILTLAIAGASFAAFALPPLGGAADDFNDRNCGWPIALSPAGPGNVQGPDSASRYWIMPLDTTQYRAMTIHGAYPEVRYFSFVAYDVDDNRAFTIADHLFDAQIVPDKGSANPFVSKGNGTYTVVVSPHPAVHGECHQGQHGPRLGGATHVRRGR